MYILIGCRSIKANEAAPAPQHGFQPPNILRVEPALDEVLAHDFCSKVNINQKPGLKPVALSVSESW
jgi:hypothetical protein